MNYLILLRPLQWIKNLLVVAPIFFAVEFYNIDKLFNVFVSFVIFSLVASSVYILNDILDRNDDKNHPVKKNRPIAKGVISVRNAIIMLAILLIPSIYFTIILIPHTLVPIILYLLLNIFYSYWFKKVVILDVIVLAVFYLVRIIVGGLAADVYISPWIVLCIVFLSLFIGLAKRRAELERDNKRVVLDKYGLNFINKLLLITTALTITSYGLYSILGVNNYLGVYSTMFVVFAFFRYLYILETNPIIAEFPERVIFTDKPIMLTTLTWIIFMLFIFYVN